MTEKEFTICGHGSGTPSTKNMYDYLTSRQNAKASNGLSKGLVEVVRFLQTDAQRKKFHDTYKTLLGRNIYSQSLRSYVYSPYKDGKYYSDCSSSGCYTYEKCGISGVKSYNTAYMHYQGKNIGATIKNGHLDEKSLGLLMVGDALLFRGNDPSRPLQIGHVEYVYEVPSSKNDGWVKQGTDWYYCENGEFQKKKWIKTDRHWYRVGNDGKMLTGWHKVPDDKGIPKWCYFEEGSIYPEFKGAEWISDGYGYQDIWTTKS